MCLVGCSCAEGVGQGQRTHAAHASQRIASAPYSRMNSRTSIRKTVSFCENRSRFTPSRVLRKGAVQKGGDALCANHNRGARLYKHWGSARGKGSSAWITMRKLSHPFPSQPCLVLWDTLCSCEAYGMRPAYKECRTHNRPQTKCVRQPAPPQAKQGDNLPWSEDYTHGEQRDWRCTHLLTSFISLSKDSASLGCTSGVCVCSSASLKLSKDCKATRRGGNRQEKAQGVGRSGERRRKYIGGGEASFQSAFRALREQQQHAVTQQQLQ